VKTLHTLISLQQCSTDLPTVMALVVGYHEISNVTCKQTSGFNFKGKLKHTYVNVCFSKDAHVRVLTFSL